MKYQIKNATELVVQRILNLDTSDVDKMNRRVWKLPESEPIEESYSTLECLRKLELVWNRGSENTTRTYIDLILLDVLSKQSINPEFKFNCFGEVSNLYYPKDPSREQFFIRESGLFSWLWVRSKIFRNSTYLCRSKMSSWDMEYLAIDWLYGYHS